VNPVRVAALAAVVAVVVIAPGTAGPVDHGRASAMPWTAGDLVDGTIDASPALVTSERGVRRVAMPGLSAVLVMAACTAAALLLLTGLVALRHPAALPVAAARVPLGSRGPPSLD
jgi:hypothetical protein